MKQLSDMFEFQVSELLPPNEMLFRKATLLQDIYTYKGTYVKGTEFEEVYLEFPSLLMTFMIESPLGICTEFEINVRIEPDI